MMNMGGPSTLNEVNSFLTNLFSDKSLINLPFQSVLGPLIAKVYQFLLTMAESC